jgi:hypothetical protein
MEHGAAHGLLFARALLRLCPMFFERRGRQAKRVEHALHSGDVVARKV